MAQEPRAATQAELPPESSITPIAHSDIAALAYQLWEDRGCPFGSPEEDWQTAEQQLSVKVKARSAVA